MTSLNDCQNRILTALVVEGFETVRYADPKKIKNKHVNQWDLSYRQEPGMVTVIQLTGAYTAHDPERRDALAEGNYAFFADLDWARYPLINVKHHPAVEDVTCIAVVLEAIHPHHEDLVEAIEALVEFGVVSDEYVVNAQDDIDDFGIEAFADRLLKDSGRTDITRYDVMDLLNAMINDCEVEVYHPVFSPMALHGYDVALARVKAL